MNNPGFRFNRLENYLVLHKNRDRSFMIKDGYRYLCDLRKMMSQPKYSERLLRHYTPEDIHKFRQFLSFLNGIGFITHDFETQSRISDSISRPFNGKIRLNDALFDELHLQMSQDSLPENLYFEITRPSIEQRIPQSGKNLLAGREIHKLFTEFEAMGGRHVCFAGKDPFAWKGFLKVLRITADFGFGIEIVTDGAHLSPKLIPLFKTLKIDNLLIQLKDQPGHNGISSSTETKKLMDLLKQNRIRYTAVCPVTENIRNSISVFSLLANKHAKQRQILDFSPQRKDRQITTCDLAHNCSNKEGVFLSEGTQTQPQAAPGGKRAIRVTLGGDVYLGYNGSYILGNLHDKTLLEIWRNKLTDNRT
jgi:hypothetical protein